MGMFPKNVIGSSSESNVTITLVDTDARARVSTIGALSARAGRIGPVANHAESRNAIQNIVSQQLAVCRNPHRN